MAEQIIDLKQLLLLIHDNKDFAVNFILDEGCTITAEDPKPLVKVINYLINYLTPLSAHPLEISCDLRGQDCLVSMMAYTEKTDLPPVSDQIAEVLNGYKGKLEKVHENGKYLQFKLSFTR